MNQEREPEYEPKIEGKRLPPQPDPLKVVEDAIQLTQDIVVAEPPIGKRVTEDNPDTEADHTAQTVKETVVEAKTEQKAKVKRAAKRQRAGEQIPIAEVDSLRTMMQGIQEDIRLLRQQQDYRAPFPKETIPDVQRSEVPPPATVAHEPEREAYLRQEAYRQNAIARPVRPTEIPPRNDMGGRAYAQPMPPMAMVYDRRTIPNGQDNFAAIPYQGSFYW